MGNLIARFFMLLRKRRILEPSLPPVVFPHPTGPTVRHLGSPPLRGEDNALTRPWLKDGHTPEFRLQLARARALYEREVAAWG
ncbi:hypothetical protein SGFS_074390 [Streptomyces graminofaciens]|uniref:Uncharacterized protein n=1 Tax=Streptomyces graminofaciens TaxID=68212 RepID=A0ABN5VS52_9ACTN|nr:hypothetical protein [Streptomyces graminofaciens]BBC36145.1 hypothetical protein SGFS_074390 [Streptomyces graminofaciens]